MICQPGVTPEANCTHLVSSISDKVSAVLPWSARRLTVHSDSLISIQALIDTILLDVHCNTLLYGWPGVDERGYVCWMSGL